MAATPTASRINAAASFAMLWELDSSIFSTGGRYGCLRPLEVRPNQATTRQSRNPKMASITAMVTRPIQAPFLQALKFL